MQRRESLTGRQDIMPISEPKGPHKGAKFLPAFILIPGFKVQVAGSETLRSSSEDSLRGFKRSKRSLIPPQTNESKF